MKTIVVHDEAGRILSFMIPIQELADQVKVEVAPGQRAVWVDSTDFGIDTAAFDERPRASRPPVLPRIIEEFQIVDGKVARRKRPRAKGRS